MNRPLRIARIIARLNVGGPAQHVVWLTEGMNRFGWDTTLIVGKLSPGEADMADFAKTHGVAPFHLRGLGRALHPADLLTVWRLFREFLRIRPDVVHTHTAKAGAVGRAAAFLYRWASLSTLRLKPRRVAIVHTFHGHVLHGYYGAAASQLFVLIERTLAFLATDRIIALSPGQRDELHGRFGIGRLAQYRVIPLAIDESFFDDQVVPFQTVRTRLGLPHEAHVVGIVGRLVPIKNHKLLFEAFALLVSRVKNVEASNLILAVIGDGPLRGSLVALAEKLGIANHVRFLGTQRDQRLVYSALDVLALTSLNEGTPLAVIEAFAARVPVMSTLVGGVTDLLGESREVVDRIEIRERGLGIRGHSDVAVADALQLLLLDHGLRESLTARAFAGAKTQYSTRRLVEDVSHLYLTMTEA